MARKSDRTGIKVAVARHTSDDCFLSSPAVFPALLLVVYYLELPKFGKLTHGGGAYL